MFDLPAGDQPAEPETELRAWLRRIFLALTVTSAAWFRSE